MDRNLEGI